MKKVLILFVALLFVFQSICCISLAADDSGTPKHIPRIVSIVFDDSGSMYSGTDRWAYTNYAMQTFIAMMGHDDILYVTYLNAPAGTVNIVLSDGKKQTVIDDFAENTAFGSGTPNKLKEGAQCLEKEYAIHGANAKYYLVVMADGELDYNQGDFSVDLPEIASETRSKLSGVDFDTIYFAMGEQKTAISGVTNCFAPTGDDIVTELKKVSADIMGRTDVTEECKVTNGQLSFELKYPALSVTLFAQKENTTFSGVTFSITKDGSAVSYNTSTYSVKCPDGQLKNKQGNIKYEEELATNPPAGFVSLITNGSSSLPKGNYSVDLSAYSISKDDIVVLVEPAVKIGCKYYLGDSDVPMEFSEIKEHLRSGDKVMVRCGLYEINEDGSLGNAVPDDILSPEYKLYVNNTLATQKLQSEKNAYELIMSKDYEDKELKIEAVLEGYQPFVLRETFGKLSTKPVVDISSEELISELTLTKPLWNNWLDGKESLSFPLMSVDESVLSYLEIKADGFDRLATGSCLSLSDCVKTVGNNIFYTPKLISEVKFGLLPESFSVSLYDSFSDSELARIDINVIQPEYRFEIENDLEGEDFSLALLKTNSKEIRFSLAADYYGKGEFAPISQFDCESDYSFAIDTGSLPGDVAEDDDYIAFVPQYDSEENTDISPEEILGKGHNIFATATIDGVSVRSEAVTFSINSASYRIVVENGISSSLNLDTIKNNKEKIVFSVQADYESDGSFGELAAWDLSVYDKLVIDTGSLPGKFATEYDASKKPVGKSFTPIYDENNNNGIVFTEVAGRTHAVTGSIEQYGISSSTTVEVVEPIYEVAVRKDGITLVDINLLNNQEGVEFLISRNGRTLSKEEIEGLAPYSIVLSRNKKSVSLETEARVDPDGTAYLFCKPGYNGWTFISPVLWNWSSLYRVHDGDMDIALTVGNETATAQIHINTNQFAWIILLIILASLAFIAWIAFCYMTCIRFSKGKFYTIYFSQQGSDFVVSGRHCTNPNKKLLLTFFKSSKGVFLPYREITKNISGAQFKTKSAIDNPFKRRSYPVSTGKNHGHFNQGNIATFRMPKLLFGDQGDLMLDLSHITGRAHGEQDITMSDTQFLAINNENAIILFVTKDEEANYARIFGENNRNH